MTHRFARLRRFHFNLPQRIAAGLLAAFLIQGFWLIAHQELSDSDYQYARCGREIWEKPSPLAGYFTPAATSTTASSPTARPAFRSPSISSSSAASTSFASPKTRLFSPSDHPAARS